LALIKVLVVGKYNSLVHWTENTVEAFQQAGCSVGRFAINGEDRVQALYVKFRAALNGDHLSVMADRLECKLKTFQPDLIVFVLGAWLPDSQFQVAQAVCPKAIKVGWVGDNFDRTQGVFAKYMDWVFYTDTHFMSLLCEQGYEGHSSYLPLAMDPKWFFPINSAIRSDKIVYVARHSPGREQFLRQIKLPISIYGRKWKQLKLDSKHSPHDIHAYNFPLKKLPLLYASSCAVLNIKNELNVAHGVNQRSFEPYGCQTPVLHDDVKDIDLCFEVGREILVYRSIDELHELHTKLTKDNLYAQSIGQAGYKRVMAEHTYVHRAMSMLRQLNFS